MKKLFSYLLISSMVVLSSCTNYDDQFDDLNAQIKTLKSQIEGFSSISSGLTTLEGTVKQLQAAIIAIDIPAATDISGLESSLTALAADLAKLKLDLAAADTSAAVAALQTALTKAQADLAELLAANNVYTGDVVINSASTLTAAEALGGKVGIINGNVYITQSSTAIDATKLQTVVSKMVTVVGSVSYTHSGTGVTAVNFDKLTGAGTLFLDQQAPVDLPVLASAGVSTISATTKLTSINMPLLASVTSFNNGTADNMLGGTKVTSVDLGSLARYTTGTLTLTLSLTGDTTLDLASLTTTNATTGLVEKLDLSVVGGDDLSLPLFVKGDISATNVKSLVLPKFIYTNGTDGTLAVTGSKLESIAMHEVRGSFALSGATKLASVDFIGTIDTTVTSRSVGGSITIGGDNPSLTKASFAGILAGASITGASDLTDITTSGMIRAFTLDGSDDLTTLTLGHKNITGITGTNGENAGNSSALTIQNNAALTSFSASELASLGTLIVKDNASLTAFTLKSTLSLGTALSSAGVGIDETVNVNISGNELTGSVQRASGFNVSPAVTGKITQASLNGISTYLKAVEAAIKHGDLTGVTGDDTPNAWDRTTGLYTAKVASGGANTGYTLTNANVVIDNITANLSAAGVDAGASADYNVIAVTTKGVGTAAQGEVQAADTDIFAVAAGSLTVNAKGGTKSYTMTAAGYSTEFDAVLTDTFWTSYGVDLTGASSGANNRVKVAISGSVSPVVAATDEVYLSWTSSNKAHTVTGTLTTDSEAEMAIQLAAAFNTYNIGTASGTVPAAIAKAVGDDIYIWTGTRSGTTDFKINVTGQSFFPGLSFGYEASATNPTTKGVYTQVSDAYITANGTASSTATTAAGLSFSITAPANAESAVVSGTTHVGIGVDVDGYTPRTYGTDAMLRAHKVSSVAVDAVAANITMRATWL